MIGSALGRLIRVGDVLLFDGPLGAGKTTLVRAIAGAMAVESGGVASPTFVMIHEYPITPGAPAGSPELIHIDAYRLSGAEELDTLGWDTVIARVVPVPPLQAGAAVIIEWAERLGALSFAAPARLRIEHIDETSREFHFELPDSWSTRAGLAELTARRATTCPVTGQRVEPDSPTYPFASERARLADLHRWFSGSYQVSRDATDADFDEPR